MLPLLARTDCALMALVLLSPQVWCAQPERGPVEARRPRLKRSLPPWEQGPRTVRLSIVIDEQHRASGTLTLTGIIAPGFNWQRVLEEILGARVSVLERDSSLQPAANDADDGPSPRVVPHFRARYECTAFLDRRRTTVVARIDPRALVDALRRHRVDRFEVYLSWPKTGMSEITPSPFLQIDPVGGNSFEVASVEWGPNDTAYVAPIEITYGYPMRDCGFWFSVLAGVLLLPIPLTLWLRRRALRAQSTYRAAVWFSYVKRLNLILGLAVLAWVMLVVSPVIRPIFRFFVPLQPGQLRAAIELAAMIVPALALSMIMTGLSYPVYSQVRGAKWTRLDLVKQVLWREAVFALPLFMCLLALNTLADGSGRTAVLWLGGALLGWIFASRRLAAAVRPSLHVVTTGPLRDRIVEMAESAGVKLQHIFVLDASKSLEPNAAAIRTWGGGNSVLVTDYLLRGLNRAEVDAVIAHELAHLKAKHGGHPVIVYFVCMLILVVAGTWVTVFRGINPDRWLFLPVPLVVVLPTMWNRFRSRRQEFAADRDALRYTDDPEAHITGLVRIHNLGMLPLHWNRLDETWLTHPSTKRRVERIGRYAGLPSERVEELIREAQQPKPDPPEVAVEPEAANRSDRYPLPEGLLQPERVFTTPFKQNILHRQMLFHFAILAIVPAGLLAGESRFGLLPTAVPGWSLPLIAAAACWLLLQVFQNFLATAGFPGLRRRLAATLAGEGIDASRLGGRFVSFSPADGPRFYEGFTNWDVGFLMLFSDRLVYLGDQVRFALRREQVERLWAGECAPEPWYPKRVYVAWRNEAGNAVVYNFGDVEGRSLWSLSRAARRTFERIECWHSDGEEYPPVPQNLSDLSPPQLGEVSGMRLRDIVSPRAIVHTLLLLSALAAGAAYVLDLSFRWPSGSAWQAVLSSGLALLLVQLPYLVYREAVDDPA